MDAQIYAPTASCYNCICLTYFIQWLLLLCTLKLSFHLLGKEVKFRRGTTLIIEWYKA